MEELIHGRALSKYRTFAAGIAADPAHAHVYLAEGPKLARPTPRNTRWTSGPRARAPRRTSVTADSPTEKAIWADVRLEVMRAAIVGIGGVGRILCQELAHSPEVQSLLLLDKIPVPRAILAGLRRHTDVAVRKLDAARTGAVARAIRGYDIVANTSLPRYNAAIMKGALAAGADYLDVSSTGPRRPGAPPGILKQLEMDPAFSGAGRTALLSMGLDPGMSNVMAREAANRLDRIDEIRIRSGGTVKIRNGHAYPRFVPLYSREAFFEDLRIRPTVWQDGRLIEHDPLSGGEDYEFPAPVGNQMAFLVAHEEVKTLPLFLGKPVARVDFKYAVNRDLALALQALENLDMFGSDKRIAVDHARVPFRAAFESVFPEPATIAQRVEGTKCLSVEVEGTRAGVRRIRRENIVFPHREAVRRRRTTAVYYLTGVAASIGVRLLERGVLPSPGVYPAESLDPADVFREWEAHDLPIVRLEFSAQS